MTFAIAREPQGMVKGKFAAGLSHTENRDTFGLKRFPSVRVFRRRGLWFEPFSQLF
jgi:hypothetical protein